MDETSSGTEATQVVSDDSFDAYYFAHCCGRPYLRDEHWLSFFGAIADRIATQIKPRRALDAGCALGILVEALRARGIEAEGIDVSSFAIAHVHESARPFCRRGSIVDEFPDRYDLIVCIEVLEHIPARDGEAAIANICRHTEDALFSSSPSDHREPSHVNVQPAEYWAELFARQGFYRDVDFDASFLTPWAVRFRRSEEPLPRIVRNYERQFAALAAARNDARSFSVDAQRDLARTQRQVADLTEALERERAALEALRTNELASVRAALEETHAQLTRKIMAMEALEARATALQAASDRSEHERRHARETIALMETSVFWRVRGYWARLSRLLGRPT